MRRPTRCARASIGSSGRARIIEAFLNKRQIQNSSACFQVVEKLSSIYESLNSVGVSEHNATKLTLTINLRQGLLWRPTAHGYLEQVDTQHEDLAAPRRVKAPQARPLPKVLSPDRLFPVTCPQPLVAGLR